MSFRLADAFNLRGRVAVITGAANILGPEFAAGLAEYGATVILLDLAGERCAEVAAELASDYQVATEAHTIDVADEDAVSRVFTDIDDRHGRLDILVNAAATKTPNYYRALAEYELEDWNRVMAVNLTATFLCVKHAIAVFSRQRSGTIINVASQYGVVGPDPRIYEGSWYLDQRINTPAVYAASKGGVVNLTRYLATTLAPIGVRVNCLSPGGVSSGQNDEFIRRYSERVPLGRMARREELRGSMLFLASDASSYVNGHNLVVDGGWTAW